MFSTLILVLVAQHLSDNPQAKLPTDEEVRSALLIYRELGLALPPEGSELVAFPDGAHYGDEKTRYRVGFRFRPPGSLEYKFLIGLSVLPSKERSYAIRESDKATVVTPPQLASIDVSFMGGWNHKFEANEQFTFGFQLADLGELEVAKWFVAAPEGPFTGSKYNSTITERVYALKARELFAQYSEKNADVQGIVRQIRAIYDKLAGTDADEYPPMERRLAKGIILANSPPSGRPGTDEQLIDRLVNYGVVGDGYGYWSADTKDPYMTALLARGKAIIPTLIAHMEDERATRTYYGRMNKGTPGLMTIGGLCSTIVASLSSSRFVNRGWLGGTNADEWWSKASKMTEDSLLKRAIFYHEEDRLSDGDDVSDIPLNSIPLSMYLLRYPSKLDELYIESLNWKRNSNSDLAYRIEESSLPDARKLELFKTAAEKGSSSQQATAARLLEKYDPAAALDAIKRALKQDDPFGKESHGDMRASSLTAQVFRTKDQEAIDLLIDKAKSRDTGIRMNVINGMHEAAGSRSPNVQDLAIAGLRQFLSDSSIHKTSMVKMRLEEFDDEFRWDPSDLWEFENAITVRDYAAWCIGRLLKFPIEPEAHWDTKNWTDYRAMIEDRLKGG